MNKQLGLNDHATPARKLTLNQRDNLPAGSKSKPNFNPGQKHSILVVGDPEEMVWPTSTYEKVFSQIIFDDSKTIECISITGVSECGPWTPQVSISWVVDKNHSTFRSLSQDFCYSLKSMFLTISLDESHVQ